jgi:hypothetical protein
VKDSRQIAFKFKVIQEYEVIIYYENGILANNKEEEDEAIVTDVLDLAFQHEGLVLQTEEESENSNAYIGLVTTFDPTVEEIYNVKEIPTQIKLALKERGLLGKD